MEPDLSLYDYWLVLKRNWRTMVSLPLAVGIAGAAITVFAVPRSYEATATLLVHQSGRQSSALSALMGQLPLSGASFGLAGGQTALDTYKAIVQSRQIRGRLLEEFDLIKFFDAPDREWALESLAQVTAVSIDSRANAIIITVTLAGTPKFGRAATRGPGDIQSRKLAAALVNAYVQHLQDYLHTNTIFQAQQNRKFVEAQKLRAERDLQEAERDLLVYQDQQGVISLPEETKALIEYQAELTADRTRAELQAKQAADQAKLLKERLLAQAQAGVTDAFPDSRPLVEETRKQLAQLEVELAAKSESLAETNPEVIQLRRQVEETKAQLKGQLAELYSAAEQGLVTKLIDTQVELVGAEASVSGLTEALSRTSARLDRLPAKALGIGQLKRQLEVRQEVYKLLCTEYERAKIEEAREVPQFDILDSAQPPVRKSAPSGSKNVGLCLVLGLLLGVLVSFWRAAAGEQSSRAAAQEHEHGPAQ